MELLLYLVQSKHLRGRLRVMRAAIHPGRWEISRLRSGSEKFPVND